MKYHSDGSPLSDDGFEHARLLLDVDAPTLWAVLHVETGGFGYLPSRRPVIRFERHVFHQLTAGRFDLEQPYISNPLPGGYIGGPAEYVRLNSASMLDADAALQSASWGIGQLMGYNVDHVGYQDVQQMVTAMVDDEDDQIIATARFIEDCMLNEALQDRDWTLFASVYNGSDFGRDGYDVKLAAAFEHYQHALPNLDVRTAQAALLYLGYKPGPIDGVLGPRTRKAVIDFQRNRRMTVTGSLDRRMTEALCVAAFAA